MDILKEIFDLAKLCRERVAQLTKLLAEANSTIASRDVAIADRDAKLASVEVEKKAILDELNALKADAEKAGGFGASVN